MSESLLGAWMLEYVAGLPVIDRSPAYIEFAEAGVFGGSASCNQMSGSYEVDGAMLSLGPVATTRRACFETLMNQEARVLEALPNTVRWRIENGLLYLLDAEGEEVVRAARREN